jgi:hypothetical protein
MGSRKDCLCAFCGRTRKVYQQRRIGFFNVMVSFFGAGILMFFLWGEFEPKAIFIFVCFLALSEMFIQMRWRIHIVCRHCGFDPVIYVKDPGKASEKVVAFLEKRRQDPVSLLAAPLNLPKITPQRKKELQQMQERSGTRGRILSRQI